MICKRENLKMDPRYVKQLIESSGSDLRQIINILQMWKNQNVSNGGDFLKNIAKDEKVMINNYDAAHRLLNM